MKRILSVFLLIGTLMLPLLHPVSAFADTTTVITSVPKEAAITVEIEGCGTVWISGQPVTKNSTIFVDRLKEVTAVLSPDPGYALKVVYLNGEDVTQQLVNGKLAIGEIQFDTVISVLFTQEPYGWADSSPATGDAAFLYFVIFQSGIIVSITLLLLICGYCIRKRLK